MTRKEEENLGGILNYKGIKMKCQEQALFKIEWEWTEMGFELST